MLGRPVCRDFRSLPRERLRPRSGSRSGLRDRRAGFASSVEAIDPLHDDSFVLDAPTSVPAARNPPRLFSKDDHRFLALIDCRRDLDEAKAAIERFEARWFVQDPPDKDGAREAAAELRDTAQRLRNSALNLLYLTRAGPEGP
jgi:hypothetical protein